MVNKGVEGGCELRVEDKGGGGWSVNLGLAVKGLGLGEEG